MKLQSDDERLFIMSNPPNWLMWLTVIIVTIYVLDIALKLVVYAVQKMTDRWLGD